MKPIKVVHIDDEKDARSVFEHFIKNHFPHVKTLVSAGSALEGIKQINQIKPDVVFLDIKMPGGGGFDILESLGTINFEIVFLTGYNEYAIDAIKKNALYYLLKPIDIDELEICFEKIDQTINQHVDHVKINKLSIPHQNGVHLININDILYLEANSNYTDIHTIDKRCFTASKTLKDIEEKLPTAQFFRSHRSYIVNLQHVHEIIYKEKIYLELINKLEIPLSNALKEDFLNLFEN